MKRAAIGLTLLLLLQGLALLLYLSIEEQRHQPRAKSFAYEKLSGTQVAQDLVLEQRGRQALLSSYRGKLVLLHFWASWCEPCREELPGLLALTRDPAVKERLVLLAVNVDESWDKIEHFFGGEAPPEVYRDVRGDGRTHFGVSALPDTYIIGARGEILIRLGGARDWRSPQAKLLLERL